MLYKYRIPFSFTFQDIKDCKNDIFIFQSMLERTQSILWSLSHIRIGKVRIASGHT